MIIYAFDALPVCDGQTDRRTDRKWICQTIE